MHLPSSWQCGAILHRHATRHESKGTNRAATLSSTSTLGRSSLVICTFQNEHMLHCRKPWRLLRLRMLKSSSLALARTMIVLCPDLNSLWQAERIIPHLQVLCRYLGVCW